jgi:lipopolysaccharide transport system ATP-binding protein
MTDIAIKVEGLSKLYRIGHREPYRTLRDSITKTFAAPIRWLKHSKSEIRNSKSDFIWALKDVSFEVKQGEVIGIIGRNGAGKSTLLKILSRITEPTEGYADIYGRIGSLLEVGTGFHPELTGRENIFLNGAILGMRKQEIKRHFDEIVDFAEVEKFIDTPVKHYSSGMFMRLAFAVAAHLDTEILLIDEVLAVGDTAFQKKCLGKMGDVAKIGRTVLFVSHHMGAVNQICQQGILIEGGRIVTQGRAAEVVYQYLASVAETSGSHRRFQTDSSKPIQILSVTVTDSTGQPETTFCADFPVCLDVCYQVHKIIQGSNLALLISRNGTDVLCSFDTDSHPGHLERRVPGIYRYKVLLPAHLLKAGLYSVHVDTGIINRGPIDKHRDAVSFRIEDLAEDVYIKGYAEHRPGVIRVPVLWEKAE